MANFAHKIKQLNKQMTELERQMQQLRAIVAITAEPPLELTDKPVPGTGEQDRA